uniref:Uncharacterized protein n=1 Tax=Heterorhabditis bacteriophora TaxID=37862 RepID=A0A1I7XP86_HETBA
MAIYFNQFDLICKVFNAGQGMSYLYYLYLLFHFIYIVNPLRMYKIGDGIEKNLEEAKKYMEKAREIMEAMKSKDMSGGFTG